MVGGPNFIDRDVFTALMADVPRRDGTAYEDVATVYGDMSRLAVALLARTPPDELRALYNELGWLGSGNGRAMHAAAVVWMSRHRSAPPAGGSASDAEPGAAADGGGT